MFCGNSTCLPARCRGFHRVFGKHLDGKNLKEAKKNSIHDNVTLVGVARSESICIFIYLRKPVSRWGDSYLPWRFMSGLFAATSILIRIYFEINCFARLHRRLRSVCGCFFQFSSILYLFGFSSNYCCVKLLKWNFLIFLKVFTCHDWNISFLRGFKWNWFWMKYEM